MPRPNRPSQGVSTSIPSTIPSVNQATQGISSGPTSSLNPVSPTVDSPARGMGDLTVKPFAKRPGFGIAGDKVEALVNYFETDVNEVPDLLEYTFKLSTEDTPTRRISSRVKRRVVFLLLDREPGFETVASDYTNVLISTYALTLAGKSVHTYQVDYFEEEEFGPRLGERKLLLQVTVTYSQQYKTEDFIAYQNAQHKSYPLLEQHLKAFQIILGRGPCQDLSMVTTARREKFFKITPDNGRALLGDGLHVYKGYFRSVRLTTIGLMVNLNVAASAMYQDIPLDKLINTFIKGSQLSLSTQLTVLDSRLKFLRVKTTYRGREVRKTVFKMARTSDGSVPTSTNIVFTSNDKKITVERHFGTTYPDTRRPNRRAFVVNVGNAEHPVYIPSDLCIVLPGQPYRGPLPQSAQTREMIRFACRNPADNMHLILEEGLPQMGVGINGGPASPFKFGIEKKMAKITARLLPAPNLCYESGVERNASSGGWNMTGKTFKTPAPEASIKISWIDFLLPGVEEAPDRKVFLEDLDTALRAYCKSSSAKVVHFADFPHTQQFDERRLAFNWNTLLGKGIKLVVVLLPSKSASNYGAIKTSAEAKGNGIHTVCTFCLRRKRNKRVSNDDLANLMLKINTKLGGVNLTLDLPPSFKDFYQQRIMFIGADVVHPPPSAMLHAPSVASVVASTDSSYFAYPGSYRLQQPDDQTKKAVEFIKEFGDMCEERLTRYQSLNDFLPVVIIVYRDGVADNMFAEVVNTEVAQLQRTCKKMYTKQPPPKIVFIVVKKRGHTRFYKPQSGSGRGFDANGNPKPGFIVDQQITSAAHIWDWFLVAHRCIQGTSRPAHYVVLHDDLHATADQLQYLTFAMCFLWPRATKSISIHPAARAADIMCERAKVYLHPVYFPPLAELNQPKPEYRLKDGHWPGQIALHLRNRMFYL